jgi:hypothetical protein
MEVDVFVFDPRAGAALGRFRAALLLSVSCLITSASAQEKVTITPVGADTRVQITQPVVNRRTTVYNQVVFRPGDTVTISAGGCVQTGGHGATWKRYVNPAGPDSDKYYHGLIQIPGITLGLVRISSVWWQTKTIPANFVPQGPILLTLGYEDDDYTDNTYKDHDDGTANQCALNADGGPAWVTLYIHHGPGPQTKAAPYDLVWQDVDANGLPLNPRWGQQDDPKNPGLPSSSGTGPRVCATPWEAPCTTQTPVIVPLPSLFDPDPFDIPNRFCTFSGVLGQHANWGVVTYQGKVRWDSHSGDDDDYNIDVLRDDKSAYTEQNSDHIHTEFDFGETVHNFDTPWWNHFRDVVDTDVDPSKLINGKDIIEIGVVGLDCAHSCGSEIHPVMALAMHVNDDPKDDQWAIFVRNAGDEGFCSDSTIQAPELTKVYLALPWRPGATNATPQLKPTTVWRRSANNIAIQTFPAGPATQRAAFIVAVDLGNPSFSPMMHADLHLQWTMTGRQPVSGPIGTRQVARMAAVKSESSAANPEPEKRFKDFVATLPANVRQQIAQVQAEKGPKPSWTTVSSTNLAQAPAGFQLRRTEVRTAGHTNPGRTVLAPNQHKKDVHQKMNKVFKDANVKPPAR